MNALTGRIRQAVQAALRCSVVARFMRQSGRARVAFDYRDGTLADPPRLARSSGAGTLDAAALAAVRSAHYPPAPPDTAGQTLNLLVWVEEDCGE